MPRTTTTEFEELLAACETQSTIDLRLRDGAEHLLATDEIELGKGTYLPLLMNVGDLKESGGTETNRVSVEISNISREWSVILASDVRNLELADVQIKRFYAEIGNRANFFHKHFFGGKLVGAQATERSLTFDVIPKSTASGLCLSTRNLSPGCAFIFKDPRTCKYTGSETTCNLQLKSKHGCTGRDNTENFGGWTSPENPSQAAPGSGGNSGGGIGTGVCFLKGTKIFTPRGEVNIEDVRRNLKIYSHDPQTREIQIDTVAETFRHQVTGYFVVRFSDASFCAVTPEHPFLSKSGEWTAVDKMQIGGEFWRFTGGRWNLVSLQKINWHRGAVVDVYNFRVSKNQNYFANRFAVHNSKNGGPLDIPF